jgi:hypothetical protein
VVVLGETVNCVPVPFGAGVVVVPELPMYH